MPLLQTKNTPESPKLGIYIHIPYCVRKCDYCDFYSVEGNKTGMNRYLKALKAHIEETAEVAESYEVNTIYFGGGTPSYFGGDRIAEVLRLIQRKFRITEYCETTVECNPDTTDLRLLRTLRRAGVNRLSFGVQSANDDELRAVGRLHSYRQAQRAIHQAQRLHYDNISADLIYGLPGQTLASWQETVESLLDLGVPHLSCYGLKLEPGTPLFERRDRVDLAGDDEQADMYTWTVERLKEAGFHQYEISNFAMPQYESEHNKKYWFGEEYVGFGPGAHSYFGQRRYSFVRDVNAYIRGVLHNGVVVDESEVISRGEQAKEYLMLRMRTNHGINGQEYHEKFYVNFEPLEQKLLQFREQGWAVYSNDYWHFTTEGFLLSNTLIGELLEVHERSVMETMRPLLEKRMGLGY